MYYNIFVPILYCRHKKKKNVIFVGLNRYDLRDRAAYNIRKIYVQLGWINKAKIKKKCFYLKGIITKYHRANGIYRRWISSDNIYVSEWYINICFIFFLLIHMSLTVAILLFYDINSIPMHIKIFCLRYDNR